MYSEDILMHKLQLWMIKRSIDKAFRAFFRKNKMSTCFGKLRENNDYALAATVT